MSDVFGVMMRMIFTGSQKKIGGMVIEFIPINMVNDFAGSEFSSDGLFHNETMLQSLLPANSYQPIPLNRQTAFSRRPPKFHIRVSVPVLTEIMAVAKTQFYGMFRTKKANFVKSLASIRANLGTIFSFSFSEFFRFRAEFISACKTVFHTDQYMSDTKQSQDERLNNRVNSVDTLPLKAKAIPSQATMGNGVVEGVTARQVSPNNNPAQERATVLICKYQTN